MDALTITLENTKKSDKNRKLCIDVRGVPVSMTIGAYRYPPTSMQSLLFLSPFTPKLLEHDFVLSGCDKVGLFFVKIMKFVDNIVVERYN